MEALTKSLKIISNLFDKLGNKIDSLSKEIKRQKPPVVNVAAPEVTVNVPDVIVPEIKMPEFGAFPEYPAFPEIKLPEIKVTVPEIKIPTINVPKPEVTVNVPEANITVNPTPVTFPGEMKVIGMDRLIAEVSKEEEEKSIFEEVSSKKPLCVQIIDSKGKQVSTFGGDMTAPSIVGIKVGTTAVTEDHPLPVTVDGFAIPMFDTQIVDKTLAPATTTITYKRDGVTVATKTITVVGNITTVTML